MGRRCMLAVDGAPRAELERLSRSAVRGEADRARAVLWSLAGEPAAAGHPGEGTLDHPPAGQQDEAPLRGGRLDHLQGDAVRGGRLGGAVPGVALVEVGDLDAAIHDAVRALNQERGAATCAVISKAA